MNKAGDKLPSPPARVAWIETSFTDCALLCLSVATREGGVDRNPNLQQALDTIRAVATREGGVDRNHAVIVDFGSDRRRHPRGWRG